MQFQGFLASKKMAVLIAAKCLWECWVKNMCAADGKNVGRRGECGCSHVQPSVKCWVEEAVRLPPKSPRPIGWSGVLAGYCALCTLELLWMEHLALEVPVWEPTPQSAGDSVRYGTLPAGPAAGWAFT